MISCEYTRLHTQCMCIIVLACVSASTHAQWSNWWSTPAQKAQSAMEAGDYEQLKSIAPDQAWQGVAQHKSGEFDSAAQVFSQIADEQQAQGNDSAANSARFNQGVSEVRSGQYEKAVESFDQVLQQDPEFEDAAHNLEIAKQLIEQQQSQEGGEGDESSSEENEQTQDDSEQSESEQDDSEQGDSEQNESEQSDSDQSQSEQSQSEQNDSQQSESESNEADGQSEDEATEPLTEEQQMQNEQAARDALEAEAQQTDEEQTDEDIQDVPSQPPPEPMTESDQATEQWLRRIPDNPEGLLQRRLMQNHRTQYPEVRDAVEPW